MYCSHNVCLYKQVHCLDCSSVHHQHLQGTCVTVLVSKNKGYSIVATKNIQVNSAITLYGGTYVTDENELSLTHSLQLKNDLWLDGPPSKFSLSDMIMQNKLGSMCNTAGPGESNNTRYFIDFKCNPPKVTLRAICNIKKNHEILVPYGRRFRMFHKKSNDYFFFLVIPLNLLMSFIDADTVDFAGQRSNDLTVQLEDAMNELQDRKGKT